jgi:hypothetical protein
LFFDSRSAAAVLSLVFCSACCVLVRVLSTTSPSPVVTFFSASPAFLRSTGLPTDAVGMAHITAAAINIASSP